MKLYTKLLALSVLGASMFYSGCDEKTGSEVEKNYFTDFGQISKMKSQSSDNHVDVEFGDVDGDGDLDVILANKSDNTVRILENRIPQKNKKKIKSEETKNE